jgi:hypothetical protein
MSGNQNDSTNVTLANSDTKPVKCSHFNSGYCRFTRKGCRYFHPTEVCDKRHCGMKGCPKRHPKKCKYGSQCIFQKNCAYKHAGVGESDRNNISKTLNEEILHLKRKNDDKVNLLTEVHLKEMDALIKEIEILKKGVQISETKLSQVTKDLDGLLSKEDTVFQCDKCDHNAKLETEKQVHMNKVMELENIVVELKTKIKDKDSRISRYIFRGKKRELYRKCVSEIDEDRMQGKYCKTCELMVEKHVDELLVEDKRLNKEYAEQQQQQ